jgi:hypothetical protein
MILPKGDPEITLSTHHEHYRKVSIHPTISLSMKGSLRKASRTSLARVLGSLPPTVQVLESDESNASENLQEVRAYSHPSQTGQIYQQAKPRRVSSWMAQST